jgi:DNA-binding transcriptional regulator YbjK
MKAKSALALIGIIVAGVVLTLWKPASDAPAPTPIVAAPPSAAHEPTVENRQEQRASETIAPAEPPVVSRKAPLQPKAQPSVETVAAELLAQIQEALASTNLDEREIVFTNLLAALVHADPLAAARFAETNYLGDTHDQLLHRAAQLWAQQDSAAALDWAASLNSASERDAILTDVCLQVAERDPAEAVRTRSQYVADEQPNAGLETLAQRWAEKDFAAALDWTLSRANGEQRDQLIARLTFVQSQTSPAEAATLVVQQIPAGEAQTEAVMAVLHQWANRDLAEAAKWVELFPEGELRIRAVNELNGIAKYQSAEQSP